MTLPFIAAGPGARLTVAATPSPARCAIAESPAQ